ncbi:MAG: hypothetical protein ABIA75_09690 [Candidatus Neomarinimicrobiota bacterium]
MRKYQNILLWLTAIVITLSSAIYQRQTGPTYPVKGTLELNGAAIEYSLPRSHNSGSDAEVRIAVPDRQSTGAYRYRRFRSNDEWQTITMTRDGDDLVALIPSQPPAGKVQYVITISSDSTAFQPLTDQPVTIRYKGAVPAFILIPHILFIFIAMLLSNRSGLQALTREGYLYPYALWTTLLLLAGGLLLGPVVQKYAFDAYWTGWPWGHDLTDNKTLVAFMFWVVAVWKNRHYRRPGWVLVASIVLLLVYLIPHSVLGSELDYAALEQ